MQERVCREDKRHMASASRIGERVYLKPDVRHISIDTTMPEGSVEAYVLMGDPLTLVDVGPDRPECLAYLHRGLKELGLTISDFDQIIISHTHGDHYDGLGSLLPQIKGQIYFYEKAWAEVTGGPQEWERQMLFRSQMYHEWAAAHIWEEEKKRREEYRGPDFVVPNPKWLKDGDVIRAGGVDWRVIYTPGHSQTDMCLFHEESGYLIAGDHLIRRFYAAAFMEAPTPDEKERPKVMIQYRESFRKTRELPVSVVFPGHGEPFTGHVELIDKRLERQNQRMKTILESLRQGDSTIYEISQKVFPRLAPGAFIALSETAGYMDVLLEQGEISYDVENGIYHYRLGTRLHV